MLAAQLQALQLGGAAAQPQPVGVPAPQYGAVAGFAGAQAAGAAGGGRGSPSAAGSHAAPHQLDATFLGCTELLARLQMGAAVAAAGVPVGGTTMGLPPDALSIQQQMAVAAAMQQQQQQQQLQQQQQPGQQVRQGPPGRRRNAAGRRNEEKVRRTIYISDISDAVSEAQLAGFFADCGQLVDCRVCGDPNSSMRFAFIEFVTEEAAQQVGGQEAGAGLGAGCTQGCLSRCMVSGWAWHLPVGHGAECAALAGCVSMRLGKRPASAPAGSDQERQHAGRFPHPRVQLQDCHCAGTSLSAAGMHPDRHTWPACIMPSVCASRQLPSAVPQHVVPLRTPAALAARHPPPCSTPPSAPLLPQVNNTYLPRSQEERELVARTIFVGNIDRIVEREQLREFFENLCGERGGRPSAGAGSFWNGHILPPPAS